MTSTEDGEGDAAGGTGRAVSAGGASSTTSAGSATSVSGTGNATSTGNATGAGSTGNATSAGSTGNATGAGSTGNATSDGSDASAPFGQRLTGVFEAWGQLCVGIDPHDYLLDAWGLPRSAAGVRDFGLRVVEAAAGRVGIVKPQVAFYELYGSAGIAALEDVLAVARSAGLLVIADAKRGDIGTSVEAYGRAWLEPGSPLEADAVTLTAYTGVGSLTSVFALADRFGKGAFVLSATSNPESLALQTARVDARFDPRAATPPHGAASADVRPAELSLAALIAAEVSTINHEHSVPGIGLGNIGLVLGATKNLLDYGIDRDVLAWAPATPVLAPGFGFQGARFDQVRQVFGALTPATVVSVSRSVLQAGPNGIATSIRQQADELAAALAAAGASGEVGTA